jgi:hypothetical protein
VVRAEQVGGDGAQPFVVIAGGGDQSDLAEAGAGPEQHRVGLLAAADGAPEVLAGAGGQGGGVRA